jgi:parallel beta-helix repeat protein
MILESNTIPGIDILYSKDANLTGNKINTSNSYSIRFFGNESSHFNHSLSNNLVEGLPVNFTFNADNLVYDNIDFTGYGQVIIAWSSNVTVKNSNFSSDSLSLFHVNNSYIKDNLMNSSVGYGITISSLSNYNEYANNSVHISCAYCEGIWNHYSDHSTIIQNNVTSTGSDSYGIDLDYSWYNKIDDNIVEISNDLSYSISVFYGGNNTLTNNTIFLRSYYGWGYLISRTNNNTVSNNTVNMSCSEYCWGLYLQYANYTTVSNLNVNGSANYDVGAEVFGSANNELSGIYMSSTGGADTSGFLIRDDSANITIRDSEIQLTGSSWCNALYAYNNMVSSSVFDTILNSSNDDDVYVHSYVTLVKFNKPSVT